MEKQLLIKQSLRTFGSHFWELWEGANDVSIECFNHQLPNRLAHAIFSQPAYLKALKKCILRFTS
jgi:hypothetical protein